MGKANASTSASPWNKKTVKELKAELEKLGKSTSGLKADLVARLEEALSENQTASDKTEEATKETPAVEEKEKKEEPKEEKPVEQPSETKSEEKPVENVEKPKAQPAEQPKEKPQQVEMETEKEKEKRKAVDEQPEKAVADDGKRRKAGSTQESAHAVTKAVEQQPQPIQEETREVPPPQHPVTSFLFVRNFVRPFTIPAVEELLNKHGKVVQYAMDSVRSKCYAIYEKSEEAEATRNALHNLVWPPANKTKLWADFVPEEEATRFISQNQTQRASIKTRMVEKEQQPIKTLDDLFRKTETKPHIYYLPLTEEQVAAKKKV